MLNFWDVKDPVSGHLDFYAIPPEDNRQLAMGAKWGIAHTAYWGHAPMYEEVVREVLG